MTDKEQMEQSLTKAYEMLNDAQKIIKVLHKENEKLKRQLKSKVKNSELGFC